MDEWSIENFDHLYDHIYMHIKVNLLKLLSTLFSFIPKGGSMKEVTSLLQSQIGKGNQGENGSK